MRVMKSALLLVSAAFATICVAQAQVTPPSNHGVLRMAARTGVDPVGFVTHAALDGMTEVQLGKIALNNSQNATIRQFAQRMVQVHGKSTAELGSIAKRKGL